MYELSLWVVKGCLCPSSSSWGRRCQDAVQYTKGKTRYG